MSTLAQAVEAELKAVLEERDRYLATSGDTIAKLLKTAEGRLLALLADQPSDAAQWSLSQVQAQVRHALAEFGDQAAAEVASQAGQAWEIGQAAIDAPLAAGRIAVVGAAPVLDTRLLSAMRAFMTDRIKDVGTEAISKINTQLGLTVLGAQSPAETVTAIKEVLGETSRRRALTIVRTENSRVYSTAAFERLLQQAQMVEGLQKQWRASGKPHPRINHLAADGQVQDVTKPFKLGGAELMYPHDPKAPASETILCGCTMVPWHADWAGAMQNPTRKYAQDEVGKPVRELLAR
ncbi:phage minor head protein [Zoogloea sp.]|uniref:phage minor head protein n=1 Tax=Zoogloea sp. TaxID=49181 RepID=UPI00261186E6|nr:phage minor head protein [Zoogloea sp.]